MAILDLRKNNIPSESITPAANSFSSFGVSTDTPHSDKTVFARSYSLMEEHYFA